MAKRGWIMRDPNSGPGLVIVQGQQYPFALEGVWRSATMPKMGLVVDVDFDPSGQVAAMTAVPESQLAREQAEAALQGAKEKGARLASGVVGRFGVGRLVAAGLLAVGWWFLSAVTVDAALLGKLKITFWQVLGILNTGNPMQAMAGSSGGSTGLYGLVAVACIAAPFLAHFWKDRRAHLVAALPLAFMLLVTLMVLSRLGDLDQAGQQQAAMMGGAQYQDMVAEFQREAKRELMKALSIGVGYWLSLAVAVYLAARGIRDYLLGRAADSAARRGGAP